MLSRIVTAFDHTKRTIISLYKLNINKKSEIRNISDQSVSFKKIFDELIKTRKIFLRFDFRADTADTFTVKVNTL